MCLINEQKMLIIGISGVTNGGKTTLTRMLRECFPKSAYLCQDTYFFSKSSGLLEFRPELNSHNYDCIEAIDSQKFMADLKTILAEADDTYDFLFLDGFLLFKYEQIQFHKKYFFTLDMQVCLQKRLNRNYKSVGSMEYFVNCVWPNYTEYYEFCKSNFNDITYLDGAHSIQTHFDFVKNDLKNLF